MVTMGNLNIVLDKFKMKNLRHIGNPTHDHSIERLLSLPLIVETLSKVLVNYVSAYKNIPVHAFMRRKRYMPKKYMNRVLGYYHYKVKRQ